MVLRVEDVLNKKIIVFGRGTIQEHLESVFSNLDIQYYVDNDVRKQGTKYKNKEVKKPENIMLQDLNDTSILICSLSYQEISMQLNQMGLKENIHYIDALELLPGSSVRKFLMIDDDMENEFIDIYTRCRKYSFTSIQRMYALYKAVEYVFKNKIRGDIVECGVWKGGSAMLCALALQQWGDTDRNIYLYDTYTGMSEPTENDVDFKNNFAIDKWGKLQKNGTLVDWCLSPVDEVRKNLYLTGYPPNRIVFIEGKVEDTIPHTTPEQISILRLDTDWYESTKHELQYLFPLLSDKGIIIIDDYGHWQGAKLAVDEYFIQNDINILLNKIDYSGRIGLKIL